MAENPTTGVPVDTPVTNSGPSDVTGSSEILQVGIENQADLESQTTPEDILINVEKTEQKIIEQEANQAQDLSNRTLEATQEAADNATDAAIATIEAEKDIAIQQQENLIKVSELNIDSQESINQAQLEAANIQRQRATEDLQIQTIKAEEQREQLIKREERRVAAQKAAAAVRAHMGGMSFSGAGQDYISRAVENAAIDMESTIQTFDRNSQDIITDLRRRRDDTEFQYLNVIDAGERELRALRLEMENAIESKKGIINLSDAQKKSDIAKIKEITIARKLEIEQSTFNTISQLQQRNLQSYRNYAQGLKVRQQASITEFQTKVQTGQFYKMTDSELRELSSKTGMSVAELKQQAKTLGNDLIANAITNSGTRLTPGQIKALTDEYNAYIGQGLSPTQALAYVSTKLKVPVSSGSASSASSTSFEDIRDEQAAMKQIQMSDNRLIIANPDSTPEERAIAENNIKLLDTQVTDLIKRSSAQTSNSGLGKYVTTPTTPVVNTELQADLGQLNLN